MKSSVNKGFINYLFLFIVFIAAAVLVLGTVMMFSPGVDILGYAYSSGNSKFSVLAYDDKDKGIETKILNSLDTEISPATTPTYINWANLNSIKIKSNSVPINVFRTNENERIDIVKKFGGFSKSKDIKPYVLTKKYDSKTNAFTLILEDYSPSLTFSNSSVINVYVKTLSPLKNLEVETQTGKISIATGAFDKYTEKTLNFNNLTLTSKKGNINVGVDATINSSLQVNISEKANVVMDAEIANKISFASFSIKDGNLKTKSIKAANVYLGGEMLFANLNDVEADNFQLEIKAGDLKVNKIIGDIKDLNETIKNLTIDIKEIDGSVTLPAMTNGDVKIGSVSDIVVINNESGNVSIQKASSDVNIKTKSGSVSVLHDSKASILGSLRNVNIETTTGHINFIAKNTDFAFVNLKSQKGNIEFYYNDVNEDMTIDVTAGEVKFVEDNETIKKAKNVKGYPTISTPEKETTKKVVIETSSKVLVDALKASEISFNVIL